MKWLYSLIFALGVTSSVMSADSDGDGLLDLIDVPGFDPNVSEVAEFFGLGIQDLDGARELTDLATLRLDQNRITGVEAGDFAGLANLQTLSLSYNRLANIESAGFQGLSNLQSLDLLGNSIAGLHDGLFHGLGNLSSLRLGVNSITNIESSTFQGLSNLNWLYLAHNRLTSVEAGLFQGPTDLRTLHLGYNLITRLEKGAFEGLGTLYLGLSENRISTLSEGDFHGLAPVLLDLEANRISSIENGTFRDFTNLQTLFLQKNELTELNLAEAKFDRLIACSDSANSRIGFCVDSNDIRSLILDHAKLSQDSFNVIVGETNSITDVSLVGLTFSDQGPSGFNRLLGIATLDNVTVDQNLFSNYAAEFNGFNEIDGTTLTIIRFGDANSDGDFNSVDFVMVFEAGEYEDDVTHNSTWATGDWNGDHDFTSSDLVLAFQDGRYEDRSPAILSVPEPIGSLSLVLAFLYAAAQSSSPNARRKS